MTEGELFDLWTRWMHRRDLLADLPTVYLLASERVSQRVRVEHDMSEILASSPRMLIHAGLEYLHELAQDDDGKAREAAAFEEAVRDYTLARSRELRPRIDPFRYTEV